MSVVYYMVKLGLSVVRARELFMQFPICLCAKGTFAVLRISMCRVIITPDIIRGLGV